MRINAGTISLCPFVFSSYSGYEWEGIAPSPLHPEYASSKKTNQVVVLKDKAYAYRIDAFVRPIKRNATFETARFLAQTTFGASKRDLKEFESKYTASTWRLDECVAAHPPANRKCMLSNTQRRTKICYASVACAPHISPLSF